MVLAVVGAVLRITTSTSPDVVRLVLEGRLVGPWVPEAAAAWTQIAAIRGTRHVDVDLCDVLAIDADGRSLLARIAREGGRLIARGCAMREVVREIHGEHAGVQ